MNHWRHSLAYILPSGSLDSSDFDHSYLSPFSSFTKDQDTRTVVPLIDDLDKAVGQRMNAGTSYGIFIYGSGRPGSVESRRRSPRETQRKPITRRFPRPPKISQAPTEESC